MSTKPNFTAAEATFRAIDAARSSLRDDGVEPDASALLEIAALIIANNTRATGTNPDQILETLRTHIAIKMARKFSYFSNPELARAIREQDKG